MKLLLVLSIVLLTWVGIYWLVIKPEQIRMGCNSFAMTQMESKLTYFRQNQSGLNDEFVEAYETCLTEMKYEEYGIGAIGERIVQLLIKVRFDLGK